MDATYATASGGMEVEPFPRLSMSEMDQQMIVEEEEDEDEEDEEFWQCAGMKGGDVKLDGVQAGDVSAGLFEKVQAWRESI